jgi:molybdopterin-guanine dinucleotide biosynthesis protein A
MAAMDRHDEQALAATVGVVLAGGVGRRIGGDKAMVELHGRPLVLYPVTALRAVVRDVVVVAKRDTALPSLAGVADVWIEPDEPRHPLCGVVHALRLAGGRPVLVVAGDLPLMDAATLRRLATTPPEGAVAVVPRVHGVLQPCCALYLPLALAGLATFDDAIAPQDIVAELGIRELDGQDGEAFYDVDRPEHLLHASALLDR